MSVALADRRLWIEPIVKKVDLGRMHGTGFGMYGRTSHDPSDGSYVKTRCLSFCFIPLVPVDQWLVRPVEGRGWQFVARVPLGDLTRRLRFLGMAALAVGILVALTRLVWSQSHATVHVLNGLDVATDVTIDDGPPINVPSQDRLAVELSAGKHRFRSSVGGRIDESTEQVEGGNGLVAYNVLGAAPLYIENVVYRNDRGPVDLGLGAETKVMAGQVFVQRFVDYVFVDPPKSLTVRESSGNSVRRHATVEPGGWRGAIRILRDMGNVATSAEIAEAVAFAEIEDASVVAETVRISRALRPPDRHAAFLEKLAAAQAEAARRPR